MELNMNKFAAVSVLLRSCPAFMCLLDTVSDFY